MEEMEELENLVLPLYPDMVNLNPNDKKKIVQMCGKKFASEVEEDSIFMRKTKSGAYFVDSVNTLKACKMLAQQSINEREANRNFPSPFFMERSKPEKKVDDYVNKHINDDDNSEDVETSDEEFDIEEYEKEDDTLIEGKFVKRREPGKLAYVNFPPTHLLNQPQESGWLDEILGKSHRIGKKYLPNLEPIMQDFALNHSYFKYFEIINSMSEKAQHKYQIEMPGNEFKRFFSNVIDNVKPVQLFGSKRNDKVIKNATFRYFESISSELFSFDEIVGKLDLADIKWISTKNTVKKMFIVKNILIWLIKQYLLVILRTFFYQASTSNSTEPIFIPIRKWIKLRDDFIEGKKSDGSFESTLYRESDNLPVLTMKFYIKRDGLRPIYQTLANEEQKIEMSLLKQLLAQIWKKQSDDVHQNSLHKLWEQVVTTKSKTGRPVYFVTADIIDAYGSILQDKLLDILDELLIVLPDELSVVDFATLDPRHPTIIRHQKHFFDDSLPLKFPTGTINSHDTSEETVTYVRDSFREGLKCYLKNQIVMIDSVPYKLSRGVAQGISLSSTLANIYYGTIETIELQEFKRDGILIRYVDDFLYVTDKKESAENFLSLVKKGIPEYNCFFKAAKTHTNLGPNPETEFIYLGYKFNSNTLEVAPDYSTPLTEHNLFIDIVDQVAKSFRNRMLHFEALKLTHIVLDPKINLRKRMQNIMKSAAKRSARKCLILVRHMFDIDYLDVALIGNVIDEVVDQLLGVLKKHHVKGTQKVFMPRRWLYQEFAKVFLNDEKLKDTLGAMVEIRIQRLPKELAPHVLKKRRKKRIANA